LLFFLLVSLQGCGVTRSVEDPQQTPEDVRPVNEAEAVSGTLTYCHSGPKALREQRRNTAHEKMVADCAEGYEIVAEDEGKGACCPLQLTITFRCVSGEP